MPATLWTSAEIAAAVGGREGAPFACTGVSIDTRTLQPGDLFVALTAERDGHAFVPAARAAGAAGVLVSEPQGGAEVVAPGDTLRALERLGVAARDRSGAKRAAITGSVGKTSLTQAVLAGLQAAGRAHGAVKSFNNHIGVPLTLARMPADAERAVFELGMNHAGEIGPLSRLVGPHAVAITTVGPVHLEAFAEGEQGIAAAKAEIFEGVVPGAAAVLNADNRWFDHLAARARAAGAQVQRFGTAPGCEARLLDFRREGEGARLRAEVLGRPVDMPLAQTGSHWGLTALAALLLLEAMDVPAATAEAALSAFAPLAGRGQEQRLALPGGGAAVLLDDSYNANPLSMAAAFQTLAQRPATGRRIAVLTDMLELGPDAADRHAGLAAPLEAAGVDLVFAAGPLMGALMEALPPTRRGGYAPLTEGADSLADTLGSALRDGDVVLVKGSNGSRAHRIAARLVSALAQKAAGSPQKAGEV